MSTTGCLGGKDEPRDPAIVILDVHQRNYEQQQLLHKLRGRGDADGWGKSIVV